MSLNARQQLILQQGPVLPEPCDLRLAGIEETDDLAVFVTKRIETRVCRRQPADGVFILWKPCQQ